VSRRILALAHQAGGARAIAPVIQYLRQRGHAVSVHGDGIGAAVLGMEGLECAAASPLNTASSPQVVAEQLLRRSEADVVLTGTSVGDTVERGLIAGAARSGIPSLSVLDSWNNYAMRFAGNAGPFTHLPDLLAVMDAGAKDDLIGLGFPPGRIVVTGHPYLDASPVPTPELRRTARSRVGVADDQRLVVFASEPRDGDADGHGQQAFGALHGFLEILAERSGWHVLVKPHPTEDPATLRHLVDSARVPVALATDAVPRHLMLAADLVVGMASIFLVEAAILGTPAISFRPGCEDDDYFGSRLGVVNALNSRAHLASVLDGLERGTPSASARAALARDRLGLDGLAAQRVADAIMLLHR
jgi:hypothetical protein